LEKYQPKDYWNERLSKALNLEGVGCLGYGEQYNTFLYRSKVRAFERGLKSVGILTLTDKSVLDAGAGTGFWVKYFLNREVRSCMGLDIAEIAVANLSRTIASEKASFICADLSNPELSSLIDEKFEIITAIDMLYHIIQDDLLVMAIQNVSKVTLQQGWFIFSDSIGISEEPRSGETHVKPRPLSYWKPLLRNNGFEIRALIPMYLFIHAALSGPPAVKSTVNWIHYSLTRRISEKPIFGKAYLQLLSLLDGLGTRFVGTSLYLVFAQKVAEPK
jgi:SAM-dependent methyltransferase